MKSWSEDHYPDEDEHMSSYRKKLGILKTPLAVKFILEALEDTDEKFLILAHHKKVIELLKKGLSKYEPYIINGSTPRKRRKEIIDEFQKSKTSRLIIGNIQAIMLGWTITEASRGIFVEDDWVDANNEQAGDRLHRIGQLRDVLLQHLVFKNSFDRKVIESNLRKRGVTAQI